MKTLKVFTTAVFLCVCVAMQLNAQDTLREKLDTQLSEFNVAYSQLMESRGFCGYRSGPADFYTLNQAIEDYNIAWEIQGNAGSRKAAVLFFSFASDTLHEWLLTLEGISYYRAVAIKTNALAALERDIKSSLWTVAPEVAYNKSIRGTEITRAENDSLDFAHCNQKICSLMFPEDLLMELSKNNIGCINVIPALNIGSLPLYCLKPYDEGGYIVDSLCVNIAYSVDHFINTTMHFVEYKRGMAEIRNAGEFDPQQPLLIGNPAIAVHCESSFSALPGAEEEVTEIAKLLKTLALTGTSVTRDTLLKLLQHSDFIYLATHGYANPDDPLESYLLLGPDKMDSCNVWTAREIQKQSLSEDLVVLSACQTGLGKAHTAGLIGISRAFLIAGAYNVVMSLWSVDDAATKELMVTFVKELFVAHDFFPAGNLRQAILEYKKTDPDPAHWGAFISMGYSYPIGLITKMTIK